MLPTLATAHTTSRASSAATFNSHPRWCYTGTPTTNFLQSLLKSRARVLKLGWRLDRHDEAREHAVWVHETDPCAPADRAKVLVEMDRRGRASVCLHCVDFSLPPGSPRLQHELAAGLKRVADILRVFASLQPCCGDNGSYARLADRRQQQFRTLQDTSKDAALRALPQRCEKFVGVLRTNRSKIGAVILQRDRDACKQIHAASCAWFVDGSCLGPGKIGKMCAACGKNNESWRAQALKLGRESESDHSKRTICSTVAKSSSVRAATAVQATTKKCKTTRQKQQCRRHDTFTPVEMRESPTVVHCLAVLFRT